MLVQKSLGRQEQGQAGWWQIMNSVSEMLRFRYLWVGEVQMSRRPRGMQAGVREGEAKAT